MKNASSGQTLLPHVDLLKLVAANFIVLHHLAAYGPISDILAAAAPALMDWLYDYARMAVQVFLVVAGYLAARGLNPGPSPQGQRFVASPVGLIAHRYQRLVLPYLAALTLAMLAALLARQWTNDDSEVFLLQGLLGHDSLSAGVWYIAIDFQLFALLTLLLWLGDTALRQTGRWLVLVMVVASLFHFNRDESWDDWAIYFFGAYGLGASVYWAARGRRAGLQLGCLAALVAAALVLDFRERIALALTTALLLGALQRRNAPDPTLPTRLERRLAALSRYSYSLFLVHFPVCLLGNALFARLGFTETPAAAVGFVACWIASLGAAQLFHRWVESPLTRRWLRRKNSLPATMRVDAPLTISQNNP